MNSGVRKLVFLGSTVVAVVWIFLGISADWSSWLWILLAVLTVLAPGLVELVALSVTSQRFEPQPRHIVPDHPPAKPEVAQPGQYTVKDVLFASAEEHYRFVFSCTVYWLPRSMSPGIAHANPGSMAADVILRQTATLLGAIRPEDAGRARYELDTALGAQRVDHTGQLQLWAGQITLELPDGDHRRLQSLADVRKDEDVFESQCRYERKVRTYLDEDVLTDLGSTLVWWLAGPRTDEKRRVDEAVSKIGNFRRLSETAMGTECAESFGGNGSNGLLDRASPQLSLEIPVPPGSGESNDAVAQVDARPSMTAVAAAVVERMREGPERELFAAQFAKLLSRHGYDEISDDIARRFDGAEVVDEDKANGRVGTPSANETSPDALAPNGSQSDNALSDDEATQPDGDRHGPTDGAPRPAVQDRQATGGDGTELRWRATRDETGRDAGITPD
ncbi:hypothetical protein BAY61_21755 [Prauserella marina]|uniref:Uncharacterized protein n=1 Tax=Prauserella marina TaxID=530584 RepID=A0A222VTE0_9PSEU|nr:hypothetical protein [Prauserella marina]ASR37184.1 hypothetical protein BAY61_21755 [Prauserella marina]PWV72496.1 hypothetical protein DES30_11095 [Prauserella marina]SDD78663.1 hypothetical protein SAMN05421630_112143 [Prauserella marina]